MSEPEIYLEEERRERHWDPRRRWLAICETLTWAEAQTTVARNTAGSCLARQRKLNVATGAATGVTADDTARSRAPMPGTETPTTEVR